MSVEGADLGLRRRCVQTCYLLRDAAEHPAGLPAYRQCKATRMALGICMLMVEGVASSAVHPFE